MMAALVDSERAALQAFSRVGRYDEDTCARLVLESLPLSAVDTAQSARLVNNVMAARRDKPPT